MCQDLSIGLRLGWGGLLRKIEENRLRNPGSDDFYAGLQHVVLGMQNWISRHVEAACEMAETRPDLRKNLLEMSSINKRLVCEPPQTFREACQWILWYQMAARMYNGSGSLGKLDVLLQPFYDTDTKSETLTDEEATFHIASVSYTHLDVYKRQRKVCGGSQTRRLLIELISSKFSRKSGRVSAISQAAST